MGGRVVVVGSLNVDFVIRSRKIPSPGQTVTGGVFEQHPGGKGGNQAVASARLEQRTLFVGAVGDDDLGRQALSCLETEGVDVSHSFVMSGLSTGVALIMVDVQGENLISVAGGANAAITPSMIRGALADVHVDVEDVVLVSHEVPSVCVTAALKAAKDGGARTILNPAPAEGVPISTFGLVDYLTPNRLELQAIAATKLVHLGGIPLAAADDREVAARALLHDAIDAAGVRHAVIVTLGADGALLVARGARGIETVALATPRVRAVDTTGAGDAFNGALAASLAEGYALSEACQRAVAAGALATTRVGAREGMPARGALEECLRNAGLARHDA